MAEQEQKITLSSLSPAPRSRHRRKRLGKGESSGKGKTSGRGGKGQSARSGWSQKIGFEGGQMPLYRRLPKVGFTSRKKTVGLTDYIIVPVRRIVEKGLSGEVTIATLVEAGLVRSPRARVKIVSGTEVSKPITLVIHAATASARAAIEKAGGEIRIVR